MSWIQMNPAQINKLDRWGRSRKKSQQAQTYVLEWRTLAGRLLKMSETRVHRRYSHTLEAEIYPFKTDIKQTKRKLNTKVSEFKSQGQYLGSLRPGNWEQGWHLCSLCTKTYKVPTVYRESVNTQILFHCCCSLGAAVPSDWQSCLSLTSSWD